MNEDDSEFFWWYGKIIEEEEQEDRPNCGSSSIHFDDSRDIWICSDCGYEWESEEP